MEQLRVQSIQHQNSIWTRELKYISPQAHAKPFAYHLTKLHNSQ
jgi:hypothetical protein